ncbi:PilW family protein [Trichloromonas sp.]|uniref:PilW family protein n=1 Tax=Trichloromonas sp. TaxID=3069249 RepID=UPI003D81BBAC
MKFRRLFSNKNGMTLVEILVTSAIMGVVALAVSNLYISTQRSTTTNLEVSDVQANLRVAMQAITRDIRMAGFMLNVDPITAYNASTLTIQTASFGDRYARVSNSFVAGASAKTFNVATATMAAQFSDQDKVRVIRPSLLAEPDPGLFEVTNVGSSSVEVSGLTDGVQFQAGDLLIGSRAGLPLVQQVVYSRVGDTLIRNMNGNSQILARNVGGLVFDYILNEDGQVKTVDVTLTGVTNDLPNATDKTRTLISRVTVRNL